MKGKLKKQFHRVRSMIRILNQSFNQLEGEIGIAKLYDIYTDHPRCTLEVHIKDAAPFTFNVFTQKC